MIPLIVMNGVSHEGLFKTSGLPGETELKGQSLWPLKCFYTIVEKEKNKWASRLKPAWERHEPKGPQSTIEGTTEMLYIQSSGQYVSEFIW